MSPRDRWRKVRRAPSYKVSSNGRVRRGDHIMRPHLDKDGYLCVYLNGERTRVHTLVLEAFVSLRPYGMEGCHGPLGKLINTVGNLRWDTHRENLKDKLRADFEDAAIAHPTVDLSPITDWPADG